MKPMNMNLQVIQMAKREKDRGFGSGFCESFYQEKENEARATIALAQGNP